MRSDVPLYSKNIKVVKKNKRVATCAIDVDGTSVCYTNKKSRSLKRSPKCGVRPMKIVQTISYVSKKCLPVSAAARCAMPVAGSCNLGAVNACGLNACSPCGVVKL